MLVHSFVRASLYYGVCSIVSFGVDGYIAKMGKLEKKG